jgi:hypothetical protein
MTKKTESIHGYNLPAPRITAIGWRLLAYYVGLPVLVALMLLDTLAYLILDQWLGRCYGVSCWL